MTEHPSTTTKPPDKPDNPNKPVDPGHQGKPNKEKPEQQSAVEQEKAAAEKAAKEGPPKEKTAAEVAAEIADALKAESLDSKGKEIKLGDKVKFEGIVVNIGIGSHFDNVEVLGTAVPKPAAFGAVIAGGLPRNYYKFQAYQLEVTGEGDKPEEKKDPELIGSGMLDSEGKTQLYKAPPDFVVKSEEQKAKEALEAQLKKAAEEAEKEAKAEKDKSEKEDSSTEKTDEKTEDKKDKANKK